MNKKTEVIQFGLLGEEFDLTPPQKKEPKTLKRIYKVPTPIPMEKPNQWCLGCRKKFTLHQDKLWYVKDREKIDPFTGIEMTHQGNGAWCIDCADEEIERMRIELGIKE